MNNLSGLQKSVLLLSYLSTEKTVEVFRYLTEFEIVMLIENMLSFNVKNLKNRYLILKEFNEHKNIYGISKINFKKKALELLEYTLSSEKKKIFFKKYTLQELIKKNISILSTLHEKEIFNILKTENIQIISILLLYLKTSLSKKILFFFDNEKRSDILIRIANFEGLEEVGLNELHKVINVLLEYKKNIFLKRKNFEYVISVLKFFKKKEIDKIIHIIKKLDFKTFNKIISYFFEFNDIQYLQDVYIKFIIQNIDIDILSISLLKENLLLKNKFFDHMTNEEKKYFCKKNKDIQIISNVKIQENQHILLNIIKNFIESGHIIPNIR